MNVRYSFFNADIIKSESSEITYTATETTLNNEYIGRAYFHRAYRYYSLVFQFGHVPLLTKLPEVPKQNYRSTHRDAILKKMVADM